LEPLNVMELKVSVHHKYWFVAAPINYSGEGSIFVMICIILEISK
jgi:hypothetical protein